MKKIIAKVMMCIALFACAVFSIIHLMNSNCMVFGEHVKSFGTNMSYGLFQDKFNGLIFIVFIAIMCISYLVIINKKKCDCNLDEKQKETKHKKKLISAVVIIAITTLLSLFIIPNNSGDVWYYMACGRLDSTYGVNSYKENFKEVKEQYKEDNIVSSSYAYDTTFAYGAVWHIVCTLLGRIPTNNTLLMLFIFKMFNLLMHILNCWLVYKISSKHKIRNLLIYALNPLVIFEGLINVHNDLFMLTTILGAVYFKKKDKLLLATLSIAIGALVKYVPVLLLPYILNKEKSKLNVVAYLAIAAATYIVISYAVIGGIKDIFAFMVQTSVIANSLYLVFFMHGIPNIGVISKIGKGIFILIYLAFIIKMLIDGKNKKQAKDEIIANRYIQLLALFILMCITNFRAWYLLWLFGLITEVDEKTRNIIIGSSLVLEVSNVIFYQFGESYINGEPYFFLSIAGILLVFAIIESKNKTIGAKNEKTFIN